MITDLVDPPASGYWMQTYEGAQFFPHDPAVEDLSVVDIARALSMLCRYNGHVDRFYSVAEHSLLVSKAVPPEDALWGLLHDAAEAYVGDMIRPLKQTMPAYRDVENGILRTIAAKFGLPAEIPASVHEADARILLTERAALMSATRYRWHESIESLDPLPVEIEALSPGEAELAWGFRLFELLNRRGAQ